MLYLLKFPYNRVRQLGRQALETHMAAIEAERFLESLET